jgi:flagellar biosynthesis component FlhA
MLRCVLEITKEEAEYLKNFGDKLANARKEKGYTQEELAKRLGVTPQAVSKWERGLGYPDLELLYFICEVLECSADNLLQIELNKTKLTELDDDKQKQKVLNDIISEPLMLEFGSGLVKLFTGNIDIIACIKALREKIAEKYGLLLPVLRIRDTININENEYRIISYDKVLYSELVHTDITIENILNRLEEVTIHNYNRILNRQMVQTLVDNVADRYPAVVKGVIPDKISLALLQNILSDLTKQNKSIRNIVKIIEILEDEIRLTDNEEELLSVVVNKLGL